MKLSEDPKFIELLSDLETQRQKAYKISLIGSAVGFPIAGLGLLMFPFLPDESPWGVLAMIMLFGGFLAGGLCLGYGQKFRRDAIRSLTNSIRGRLFPDQKSEPNRGFSYGEFSVPGFFTKPDRYTSNNYMSCHYEGIPFEEAYFKLERESRDSEGHVSYSTYAEGTMYHMTFERDFGQQIKVIEKTGFSFLTGLGLGKLKKVETEYIAFNKKFQILASDDTTVFFLLTPQMQEKIMDLEGKFKGLFYLAILGNELYIAVNDSGSSISFKLSQPMNQETIAPLVELMAVPMVFVDMLKLSSQKFKAEGGL